ncbi:MAG: carboxylesterase family protein [Bacteroidaceae bacterium]|nr:carboxylesterase family protein [Bacteroidaceae bacterium]
MIVETKYGELEGIEQDGCVIFKGVPYAKAPVGQLRFKKPEKPESWIGIRKADAFGNKSLQGGERPGFYYNEFYKNPSFMVDESEDCLFLNIWIPEGRKEEKLPVAVYVHGGAFLGGAGSNLPFVCTELVKTGVIVVTINYRLGALGFLYHPLLGENLGNLGLWDQLEAFYWVKENIADFGGDENNITVFGQSAGAMSLQTLAVTTQAKGLFEKMIMQSGGGYKCQLGAVRSKAEASEIAEDFFEFLGVEKGFMKDEDSRKAALDVIYGATEEELMEAAGKTIGKCFQERHKMPFVPVLDGELVRDEIHNLIDAGEYLKIPYVLGANGDDMTTEANEVKRQDNNPLQIANVDFARIVSKDCPAYVYYFDRKLPGDESGAFHSAELWYVFGSLKYCWRPMEDHDYELSKEMIAYWSSFFKTGVPSCAGKEEWKQCNKDNEYVKVFE